MPTTLEGKFDTRRDAEMAVERLVQEHGIDRKAVFVSPEGSANSAGDEQAGADTAGTSPTSSDRSDAALEGRIVVSVEVADDAAAQKVKAALAEFDADS